MDSVPKAEPMDVEIDLSKGTDTMLLERRCPWCQGTSLITVDLKDLVSWRGGAFVQDVWPDATAGEREAMITGYHDTCYDAIWTCREM